MTSFAAETVGVSKRFGRQYALKGLDLRVPEGAVYGLLGPNGAGKTTLLKLLVGLLRPTQGEVRLFGEPWRRGALAGVGALIEAPSLYGHLSGPENLEVHTRLLGLPRRRSPEVLERVGLQDVGKKRASAYSLGMKQRLGIAQALLGEPRFLILDEPTNGLDPMGIREIRALISSFRESGITVIVSSHILPEVAQIVSHVGIIGEGELRYSGELSGLLAKGRGALRLKTPDSKAALRLVERRYEGARLEDGALVVPVAEDRVAEVVSFLGAQNVPLSGVEYRHEDLEALFVDLLGRREESVAGDGR
jgi:ABC-2 type transport system ATP-binding protein